MSVDREDVLVTFLPRTPWERVKRVYLCAQHSQTHRGRDAISFNREDGLVTYIRAAVL
jgi:hypothetical protein